MWHVIGLFWLFVLGGLVGGVIGWRWRARRAWRSEQSLKREWAETLHGVESLSSRRLGQAREAADAQAAAAQTELEARTADLRRVTEDRDALATRLALAEGSLPPAALSPRQARPPMRPSRRRVERTEPPDANGSSGGLVAASSSSAVSATTNGSAAAPLPASRPDRNGAKGANGARGGNGTKSANGMNGAIGLPGLSYPDGDTDSSASTAAPGGAPQGAKRRPLIRDEHGVLRDDLKRIKGVGPVFERRLNALGYKTFLDIAKWGPAEIDKVTALLETSPGRIRRQDWVTQARQLHEGRYNGHGR